MKLHIYLSLEIDILKTLVIRFSKIILTLKTNLSVRWTQVCYGWLALINNWQPSWCMVFLWWGLSLYSNLLAHPARAYPSFHVTWSDKEYHYSPLEGMLVHVEVPPPIAFHQASLTICCYTFILLGGERHCEGRVSSQEDNTLTW